MCRTPSRRASTAMWRPRRESRAMPTGDLRCEQRSRATNIGFIGTAPALARWKTFWRRRRAVCLRVDRLIAGAWNARGVLGQWPEPAHDRYASTARLYSDRAETDARRRPTVAARTKPAAAAFGRGAPAAPAAPAACGGSEPTAAAERQPARADRSDAARRRPLSAAHRDLRDHYRDGGAADRHGGDLHGGFRRLAGHLQGAEDGRRNPPQRADRVCPPEEWRDQLRGRVSQLARTVAQARAMPAPADQLLQQALAAHRRGAIAEAAPLYRRVLEIAPANNVACTNLAAIATAAGDFDEAETMFRRSVDLKPDAAEAHYNLGFILQEQGKLDAAIEVYRRALALRPDMPHAYTNLGVALQHQGKLDEAIAAFRQAIACNPKHVDAYFNLGVVLRAQGHVDE